VGPIQSLIKYVSVALSSGVKRPESEAEHPLPSSAKVKNAWSCTPTLPYVFMAWCLAAFLMLGMCTFYWWSASCSRNTLLDAV